MARKTAKTVTQKTLAQFRVSAEVGRDFRDFCDNEGRNYQMTASIIIRDWLNKQQAKASAN